MPTGATPETVRHAPAAARPTQTRHAAHGHGMHTRRIGTYVRSCCIYTDPTHDLNREEYARRWPSVIVVLVYARLPCIADIITVEVLRPRSARVARPYLVQPCQVVEDDGEAEDDQHDERHV